MFPEEAAWFGTVLKQIPGSALSPVVNLGSSSADYRSRACPDIDSNIFRPLNERGVSVYHVDTKPAPGVDIVGDIFSLSVQDAIRAISPRTILCNNLIEHVVDRERFCDICEGLLPPNGILCVSVPHKYPFHPDPIDTMYRPSLDELGRLFPHCHLEMGRVISLGNYLGQLRRKQWLLLRDLFLLAGGALKHDRWRVLVGNYSFLKRPYQVTCGVFRKEPGISG